VQPSPVAISQRSHDALEGKTMRDLEGDYAL